MKNVCQQESNRYAATGTMKEMQTKIIVGPCGKKQRQ